MMSMSRAFSMQLTVAKLHMPVPESRVSSLKGIRIRGSFLRRHMPLGV